MQRFRLFTPFVLALVFSFIVGCGDDDPASSSSRLRVSLSDAAGLSLSELRLDIQKIEVNIKDTLAGSQPEWVTLDYSPKTNNFLNLLRYSNGKSERLVDQFFPSGGLLGVRVVFGPGSYLRTAGNPNKDVSLNVPQEFQTEGLILDLDTATTVYPNTVCSIMLDVNVLSSIEERNGEFHFHPSVRAFPETFGGSLKGRVSPANALAYVTITQGDRKFFSWPEISDGMFLFTGLKYGEWIINVVPTDTTVIYDPVEITDTVKTGQVLNLNTITLKPKIP